MNTLVFSGRVGKDAEFKAVGTAGCYQFSVANNEKGYYKTEKDSSGKESRTWVEQTVWINFQSDMINDLKSEYASKQATLYNKVKKGMIVEILAHIEQNKSKDGKTTFTNNVVDKIVLVHTPQAQTPQPQAPQAPADDSDIPF